MNGNATKLGTGNTEIVESVQRLTKLNYIFKWLLPLHLKIESNMIYHSCHNSIWGHFLPLWPQDQNDFVLGTNMVLKWQSCPQTTSSAEPLGRIFNAFYPWSALHKAESQAHRERPVPRTYHIPFSSFLTSGKDAFYLPFPTLRVFSYWEQKGG